MGVYTGSANIRGHHCWLPLRSRKSESVEPGVLTTLVILSLSLFDQINLSQKSGEMNPTSGQVCSAASAEECAEVACSDAETAADAVTLHGKTQLTLED